MTVLKLNNEKSSLNFWAISSLMAPYYELLFEASKWLKKSGIRKADAQKYITSLFLALSHQASLNSNKDLGELVKNSQTPRGLNEQTLKFLKKQSL